MNRASDTTERRPTLLSSCALAATTAEARYRIDAAPQTARATRVVALDDGAAAVVAPLPERPWRGARFLRYHDTGTPVPPERELADLTLRTPDGAEVLLSGELAEADFVLMIATTDHGAQAASAIGNACTLRGIMTAGLILGESGEVGAAVTALRPNARVLLVSTDQRDAAGLLTALGA
ncbi:MAG TPA: hypothetical protein VHX38_11270 [Pseudonocardiaceae bacterium]|jgi:hypothetical protein|nr:hypothetical protein [Pseudonocardiaceae bacterium]